MTLLGQPGGAGLKKYKVSGTDDETIRSDSSLQRSTRSVQQTITQGGRNDQTCNVLTGPKESGATAAIESVADILERELQSVIADWLRRVELEPDLKCIPLTFEERTGHLPIFCMM